jgi:hypothetical protein
MCTGVEIALLAATAVGTTATLYAQDTEANAQEAAAKTQAAQNEADANAAEGAAKVEAERIRKAKKAQQSKAVAAAAASGVDINSPTAVKIDEEIGNNAEQDAYLTILNGQDTAARLRQQAVIDRNAGSSARTAGNAQMSATLLSAAATATNNGQGWKKAKGA